MNPRKCPYPRCSTTLSKYNPNDYCFSHIHFSGKICSSNDRAFKISDIIRDRRKTVSKYKSKEQFKEYYKEYQKAYREKNRDKRISYLRNYYEKNKIRLNNDRKILKVNNVELNLKYQKEYYLKNKERLKELRIARRKNQSTNNKNGGCNAK